MFTKLLQQLWILLTEDEKREKRNLQSLKLLEKEHAIEQTPTERNKNYFLELLARSDRISDRRSTVNYRNSRIRDHRIANFQQIFNPLLSIWQEQKD